MTQSALWLKESFFSSNFTVKKQALSLAIGVYVAFCPFIGLHTIMMLFLTWIFALNGSLMIGFSYLINNPWTMIPIYFFGYKVGLYILDISNLNNLPELFFINYLNAFLYKYFDSQGISGWAFLVGGNFVGFVIGFFTYCIALMVFHFSKKNNKGSHSNVYEDSNS